MKHVIVEGASTAYGLGAGRCGGWASLLKADRAATNNTFSSNPEIVMNMALPGQTIFGINKRFDAVTEAAAQSDGMVRILSVGINEAKIAEGRQSQIVSKEKFHDELGKYTEMCREIGAKVILMGMQPINERLTRPMEVSGATLTNAAINDYDEVLRMQARESDAKYVDVALQYRLSGFNHADHISEDGFHPSELGHRVIHRGLQIPLKNLGFIDSQPDLTPGV